MSGLCTICNLTLLLTLDIRPSVDLLLCIVLIQLLAAKPNKSIIIIIMLVFNRAASRFYQFKLQYGVRITF